MTMGLGFIANGIAFLAADKRTTVINIDGSNGEYNDNSCKIIKLSDNVLLFAGGLTQASEALKNKVRNKFEGIMQLSSNDLDVISQLCKQEHDTCMKAAPEYLKNSSWIKDFILSVIIAENGKNGPRLIRFDIEENFSPVIQSNEGALCVKSAISPEVFWPEIEAISIKLQKSGVFDPFQFIDEIFIKASKMDRAISRAYDIFYMSKPQKKLYCQKIKGGTIEATISMKSPIIYGGAIIGSSINVGDGKFIVGSDGVMTAQGATVQGVFKTAQSGARIEIVAGGLKSYNSSDQLHGLYVDPTYADLTLYYAGTPYVNIYNGIDYAAIQRKGVSKVVLGSSGSSLEGPWNYGDSEVVNKSYLSNQGYLTASAADSAYAAKNHNHDGVYSPVGHTHSGYLSGSGGSITITSAGLFVVDSSGNGHNMLF